MECIHTGCSNTTTAGRKRCDNCLSKNSKACRKYYKGNREKGLCSCGSEPTPGLKSCAPCREYIREYNRKLRLKVFAAYGGSICACCGETELVFLTIDHIGGGGGKHRSRIGSTIYSWLRKRKYPPGFRVLCFNCNWGEHAGGCPHRRIVTNTLSESRRPI